MKADICSDGTLIVKADEGIESFALRQWMERFPRFDADQCKPGSTMLKVECFGDPRRRDEPPQVPKVISISCVAEPGSTRRLMRCIIYPEAIFQILRGIAGGDNVRVEGMPADARLVRVAVHDDGSQTMWIASESFEPIAPDSEVPFMQIGYKIWRKAKD